MRLPRVKRLKSPIGLLSVIFLLTLAGCLQSNFLRVNGSSAQLFDFYVLGKIVCHQND